MNHPKMCNPETIEAIGRAALHKPSNSDVYTTEMAEYVETFGRVAKPDAFKYLFFIEGGGLAVENALKTAFDWKYHKNKAKGMEKDGTKRYFTLHMQFQIDIRKLPALVAKIISGPILTQVDRVTWSIDPSVRTEMAAPLVNVTLGAWLTKFWR